MCDELGQNKTVMVGKVALKSRNSRKRWVWDPDSQGEGMPHISDMHFQIAFTSDHMWPDMVEFRLASSEIRGRIKKEERRRIRRKT